MGNNFFAKALLRWHEIENKRSLPWKQERDPYKIWLSEIILQQTRAEQGLPFYIKFINQYPSIEDLAMASEQEVMKMWEGLGYYSRCRNMIATAKFIAHELRGIFPTSYNEIIQLKGVGPYTAAAISSFAFNEARAVIDGNVYRVIARYFGIATPIDTSGGKQEFRLKVDEVFDTRHPAKFNQAIMDLGAMICTPKNPVCEHCPLSAGCTAFLTGNIMDFPVKAKKIQVKTRHFQYWLFFVGTEFFIMKRDGIDIWKDLHQFWLEESEQIFLPRFIQEQNILEKQIAVKSSKQRLTHQLIIAKFSILRLKEKPTYLNDKGFWISKRELINHAFPKTIVSFLKEIDYF
jgi:A/G-specific adenine glycosylase